MAGPRVLRSIGKTPLMREVGLLAVLAIIDSHGILTARGRQAATGEHVDGLEQGDLGAGMLGMFPPPLMGVPGATVCTPVGDQVPTIGRNGPQG